MRGRRSSRRYYRNRSSGSGFLAWLGLVLLLGVTAFVFSFGAVRLLVPPSAPSGKQVSEPARQAEPTTSRLETAQEDDGDTIITPVIPGKDGGQPKPPAPRTLQRPAQQAPSAVSAHRDSPDRIATSSGDDAPKSSEVRRATRQDERVEPKRPAASQQRLARTTPTTPPRENNDEPRTRRRRTESEPTPDAVASAPRRHRREAKVTDAPAPKPPAKTRPPASAPERPAAVVTRPVESQRPRTERRPAPPAVQRSESLDG